uniref:TetR/AcrR family transcriptional regulator n=1 Tax=Flavobacterium sp. TaxID=239 RepID=UPI004049E695
MEHILSSIKVQVNEKIFIKDPETSELGRKIIEQSIVLIDELGFENYTFKKLGEKIGSNESSIYRYFENKHKILMYLTSWYWGWISYKLAFNTNNIRNRKDKLAAGIQIITSPMDLELSHDFIDSTRLFRIIISEFSKSYLTKMVDKENQEGYFLVYKGIIQRIVDMVEDYNPSYPYATSLISTVIEGALHQYFLQYHFTTITDCNTEFLPSDFYTDMVFRVLDNNDNTTI